MLQKFYYLISTLEDDGKSAPKKLDTDWDKQTIFLPFTSTSSGSKGIQHTHKSLVSCFYSPGTVGDI